MYALHQAGVPSRHRRRRSHRPEACRSYKGLAETALLAAGFWHVYLFRPAYIYPVQPRKEPTFSYRLLRAVYPVFRLLFPDQVVRADHLAWVMVDVVLRETQEYQALIFENRDIRAVVKSQMPIRDSRCVIDHIRQGSVTDSGIRQAGR